VPLRGGQPPGSTFWLRPAGNDREQHTRFASVQEWVEGYFVQCFVRPLGGEWRWCLRWWDHAEPITRLEALWRSWEAMTRGPALGMATWLTHYLDPQLPQLMGNRGPFARCSDERRESAKPMRTDPPPTASPGAAVWHD
jgi:hypothetical protein